MTKIFKMVNSGNNEKYVVALALKVQSQPQFKDTIILKVKK
jgi:hypothetical protein